MNGQLPLMRMPVSVDQKDNDYAAQEKMAGMNTRKSAGKKYGCGSGHSGTQTFLCK